MTPPVIPGVFSITGWNHEKDIESAGQNHPHAKEMGDCRVHRARSVLHRAGDGRPLLHDPAGTAGGLVAGTAAGRETADAPRAAGRPVESRRPDRGILPAGAGRHLAALADLAG